MKIFLRSLLSAFYFAVTPVLFIIYLISGLYVLSKSKDKKTA